jgi:hypothetical protein
MNLNDIFGNDSQHKYITDLLDRDVNLIRKSCGQFLESTNDLPVFKCLESNHPFIKIKARMRRGLTDEFSQVFNETFDDHTSLLRQRAIYAHGDVQNVQDDNFKYYIFAPDGFQFLYNPNVKDSTIYQQVYEKINDDRLIVQLLSDNYKDTDLPGAIISGSEILLFNAPCCYAVNVNSVNSYQDLLTLIRSKG